MNSGIDVAIMGSRGYPSTYGGFETLVRKLAPYLVEQGFSVTVYGRSQGSRPQSREVVDGVQCVRTWGIEGKATSTLSHGLTATLHAIRAQHDVCLVLNVANGYYLPLLRLAGIPSAVNVDGIEWERGKWSRAGKAAFRLGARLTALFANEIIVDNEAIEKIWKDKFEVRSTFIPYGADLYCSHTSANVQALGLTPDSYVLAVARLVPENNLDTLLNSLDMLPSGMPVVVVGSGVGETELERRLRRLTRERGRFIWLGHVDDQALLYELWAHAAVYYYGTTVGGTGPALLQALGCGAPVVAFDTPQNRAVLGDSATLVAKVDPTALARRIQRLLDDSAERQAARITGKRIVEDRYQWKVICDQYAHVVEALARNRAG